MSIGSHHVPIGGGIFHTPKVNYSLETKSFLKDLMAESKLTMLQRKKVNYSLRSGDPLPKLRTSSAGTNKKPAIIVRPGSSRRRSYVTIKGSGALDRDKFIPSHPAMDREFAKRHLQDLMTYGKELNGNNSKPKKKDKKPKFENRYEELKHEIQDRVEWLADMEKLGEAYKHKQVIEQQIAARIREIERLKVQDNTDDEEEILK